MQNVVEVLRSLADSDDTAFVLSRELALVRHNDAWSRFARSNGGLELLDRFKRGASIMAAIPDVLRPFYQQGYDRVWASDTRWDHEYECSSPDRFRRFLMLVYPVDRAFLVVVNANVEDVAHDRAVSEPDESRYTTDGVISMCSHCRRVRNRDGSKRWDWVPAFVAHPPRNLSHGICDACAPIYYVGEYHADRGVP